MRRAALALALLVAGCGGGDRQSVVVTEADAPAPRAQRAGLSPLDTVYADSGLFVDPSLRLDSLRADSLRRDSVRLDSLTRATPAAPDFRRFWPRFQSAVRRDRAAVAALAAFSGTMTRDEFDEIYYDAAFRDGPFREKVLALTPRDFERDGTARRVWIVVGFDVDGEIVPEDEADTESGLELRFDVVDGAYRLVGLALAG